MAVTVERPQESPAPSLAAFLVGMALFVPPLLPFDFRGDVDRMDLLKAHARCRPGVVLGQVLAPVLVVTLIQILLLAVLQVWTGFDPLLLAVLAFVPALNFLLFGLENLSFLWFPTRLTTAGPGDFQAVGRQMLLWVVKFLVLGLLALVGGLAGYLAYRLGRGSWLAAGVAAWVVAAAAAVGLVPLMALAFRQFDCAGHAAVTPGPATRRATQWYARRASEGHKPGAQARSPTRKRGARARKRGARRASEEPDAQARSRREQAKEVTPVPRPPSRRLRLGLVGRATYSPD